MENKVRAKLVEMKEELVKEYQTKSLRYAVIDYVLDMYESDEEILGFFEDLQSHGCQSGMVSILIYYVDTIKFYDEHEEEIEELVYDMRESLGIESRPLFIESLNGSAEDIGQEKNLLSWFAFEETSNSLYEELTGDDE